MQSAPKRSRLRYYVLTAVAVGAIGAAVVKAACTDTFRNFADWATYQTVKMENAGQKYVPSFLKDSWDALARYHHDASQEELEQGRKQYEKDLETKLRKNQNESNR
jgi:hypothetical protein